jgi:hypothetical protein
VVYIISGIASSLRGHGVNCGWSGSYFHSVILCVVGLLSHHVFIVLILCGMCRFYLLTYLIYSSYTLQCRGICHFCESEKLYVAVNTRLHSYLTFACVFVVYSSMF